MVIEEDVSLGVGVIVLANVTIGRGTTMVQSNPAQPIATVETPFGLDVSVKEFAKGLRLVAPGSPNAPKENGV